MESDTSTKRTSNVQLLEELEALSESLYQSNITSRRAASLALPRTSTPFVPSSKDDNETSKVVENKQTNKPKSRRMSLSLWKSRPNHDDVKTSSQPNQHGINMFEEKPNSSEKKGIWNWKPIRAISHLGKQKISCLFSVEILTAQSLPSSMNGLRLSVCVRKKESKDGSVQTMPSMVSQGAADFEETLFIKCHVYCNHQQGNGKNNHIKFEPRQFSIYLIAVDAKELSFGRNSVDLSQMIEESVEKSRQGNRVRQWERRFGLSGKAKGGELVLKLGFQVMEKDGGVEIYKNEENLNLNASRRFKNIASSIVRRRSKTSFSMPSPRITNRNDSWTPSQRRLAAEQEEENFQGMDDLNLDDDFQVHDSYRSTEKVFDDFDIPEFEVVDRGIEVEEKKEGSEKSIEVKSVSNSTSSEIVKEIVHDQLHLTRLTELDSLSKQIQALESMMGEHSKFIKDDETESQRLDSDEENVTREFLHLLEDQKSRINQIKLEESNSNSKVYLPDLGKGLGCVIQTKDGGYLASMNPLDHFVARTDTPKLAMQMSKPFVLTSQENGFELFQKLAAIDLVELGSRIFSLMPVDELIGKTAEQIAFEGIASAIIQGRKREGASSTSSAARIVSALKEMANVMSLGRQERVLTGVWSVDDSLLAAEEILAFTMQKIEFMAIEGLKIQADMAEEEAPFDVSSLGKKEENKEKDVLSSVISLEDWIRDQSYDSDEASNITLMFVVQLRDPIRRYEGVGGPMIVFVHATKVESKGDDDHYEDDEKKFKVSSIHVGGFKVRSDERKKNGWDSEKQRLTSMQWLIEYGLGKGGKKGKHGLGKGKDLLWSISSRIMADMWLKTMRNPDVKLV